MGDFIRDGGGGMYPVLVLGDEVVYPFVCANRDASVFPNPDDRPYSRVHISRLFRRAAQRIGRPFFLGGLAPLLRGRLPSSTRIRPPLVALSGDHAKPLVPQFPLAGLEAWLGASCL